MLDLHHLRHFLAVLDAGNISLAARRLHISQPALTKSIQRLEEILGAPLFDRTPKPVPTRFGQLIGPHARILLAGAGDLEQTVAQFQGLASGSLAVGAGPLMSDALVGPAVGRLMLRFPTLSVNLHIDNYSQFPDMLRNREVDFFVADITDLAGEDDLDIQPVPSQDILWFCRPGHPLLDRKRVTRKDLLDYPLATPEMPKWAADPLQVPESHVGRMNVTCSHYSTLKKIVMHSDCISGAFEANISTDLKVGSIVRIPVTDLKLRSNPGIVSLKDRALSPTAQELMKEIMKVSG